MRILAVSDSHGAVHPIEEAIDCSNPDVIIFLGDGVRKVEDLQYIYSDKQFYFIKGNCDFGNYEVMSMLTISGKNIFITHGHLFNVKYSVDKIKSVAREKGADIVLFGHTHVPYEEYDDGLYVLNPGSIARPCSGSGSYGYVDIVSNSIVTNIIYI